MKKFISCILTAILAIITIPLFAFFGQDTQKKNDKQSAILYKVLDHETDEILELSPLEYIKGVVASEIPISFNIEAIKAQAVASNTYALRQIGEQLKNPTASLNGAYLTTDYKINQGYKNEQARKAMWNTAFDENEKKLTEAVSAVIGKVITYENQPIIAAFCSMSSGKTESAKNVWSTDVSYLTPVLSEGDELCPEYLSSVEISPAEIVTALTSKYPDITFEADKTKWFSITERSSSGTILAMKVGSKTVTGKEIRETLKLRSANFTVALKGNSFTFETIGYGHGVGMSQYGADFYARQGMTYDEILLHYYTGTQITDAVETATSKG